MMRDWTYLRKVSASLWNAIPTVSLACVLAVVLMAYPPTTGEPSVIHPGTCLACAEAAQRDMAVSRAVPRGALEVDGTNARDGEPEWSGPVRRGSSPRPGGQQEAGLEQAVGGEGA